MGPQSCVSVWRCLAKVKCKLTTVIAVLKKGGCERAELLNPPKQHEGVTCAVNSQGDKVYQSSLTPLSIVSPTFSVPPSPPCVLARTAVSRICLNRRGPWRPCWGVESGPSLEDPEIRPLSANPTQYQGAPAPPAASDVKERWTELCGPLVEHQNRIQPIVPFKLSRHQKGRGSCC